MSEDEPKSRQYLDYDVVIIGAGISGLNFAYRLREHHPDLNYCILEGRHEIGGTWSLFKYPGVRSDSDLFSYAFSWRHWTGEETIAEGPHVLKYLNGAAKENGIMQRIKFNHFVNEASWTTSSKTWLLSVRVGDTCHTQICTHFVFFATGYYDYKTPFEPDILGIQDFKGTVVHPQFWPEALDYRNKSVVIIGSGATAITILPAMAKNAKDVTLLQRSPGYILSAPSFSGIQWLIKLLLPGPVAYQVIRFLFMVLVFALITFCRQFPCISRTILLKATKWQLPNGMTLEPNFNPKYKPWDQRMCISPNGGFYRSLKAGNARIKTGVIHKVTSDRIRLVSGEELGADIIITATGMNLGLLGRIKVTVDNNPFTVADRFIWKSAMIEGLPNSAFSFGYLDIASWTLGIDVTAQLTCRLLNEMKKKGCRKICPRMSPQDRLGMKAIPFINLNSTYIGRAGLGFPKAGNRPQWRPRSNYWMDMAIARWGDIMTDMEMD